MIGIRLRGGWIPTILLAGAARAFAQEAPQSQASPQAPQSQESAPASRPASAPTAFDSLESGILSSAMKEWMVSVERGDGHTDRVSIIGSRLHMELAPAPTWRIGAGLGWDTYINDDDTVEDLYPSIDGKLLPDEDQEYKARVDYHLFERPSQAVTGLLEARLKFGEGSFAFARFTRDVVQDSLLSAVGQDTPTGEGGQVRSNIASLGATWFAERDLELHASGGVGVYDGLLTPNNDMWIANAGFLYSVRRADPWLRVGYEALSYSFDKDASGFFNVPNPPGVIPGGYYSPQLYLLQQLRAEATWQLSDIWRLETGGAAGPEMVRSVTQQFEDWHWGVGARARIEAQFAPEVRAYFSYDFLNAGAADHRSVFLVGAEVRF